MIPSHQDSTAALPEPSYPFTVFRGETITEINGEEPQFTKVVLVQPAQDCIVALGMRFPIARFDDNDPIAVCVRERAEIIPQERKALNGPVVFRRWNRGLQKNSDQFTHQLTHP